jgi:hypothetical protein
MPAAAITATLEIIVLARNGYKRGLGDVASEGFLERRGVRLYNLFVQKSDWIKSKQGY